MIIDIFARYICGFTVERAESAGRAEELIRETIERNGIVPETVHADRGTAMTSKKVSQLLIDLGVTGSHSCPKVSNDNPFSEANFKTSAKEWLSRQMPPGATYQETAHQPSFAAQFDLDTARAAAPSFDKFCRDVKFLVTGERERHD